MEIRLLMQVETSYSGSIENHPFNGLESRISQFEATSEGVGIRIQQSSANLNVGWARYSIVVDTDKKLLWKERLGAFLTHTHEHHSLQIVWIEQNDVTYAFDFWACWAGQ